MRVDKEKTKKHLCIETWLQKPLASSPLSPPKKNGEIGCQNQRSAIPHQDRPLSGDGRKIGGEREGPQMGTVGSLLAGSGAAEVRITSKRVSNLFWNNLSRNGNKRDTGIFMRRVILCSPSKHG